MVKPAEDLQVAKLREGKAFVDPEADDLRGGFFGINEEEDDFFDDDEEDDDGDDDRRLDSDNVRASNSVLGIRDDDDDEDADADEEDFNFDDDQV